jgi:hypothetical protein
LLTEASLGLRFSALFWTAAASPAGVPAREPAAKLPALCHEQDLVPAPWH